MNAALRKALAASRLTEIDVAAHLGVDPKTVRRWLSGQRPYPRHRWALADLLQVEEDTLWPQNSQKTEAHAPVSEHVQRVYAHRWQVPREVWWDLFSSAEQEIGILVYSGLFLADDTGILQLLGTRAREGIKIRILLGDPESEQVKQRGQDEQIGETLAARTNNALLLFRTFLDVDGVEIRTHSTILYNSIYLTEKKLIVNHHIYGIPASQAPALEVERLPPGDMYSIYQKSFESTWSIGVEVKHSRDI
ncbi:XRE family transcriptional regulator [Nocardiopsis alborubida]|uniref:XRE family transcriptional regulator n=1 Tax=Nocardiopsis alborubida TaxID=146802 RepID=A0A7X6M7Y2_9ACTN|nr:XRE family transcriptional regulator [Nocardiopsis alborubida]NKY96074.1 XRE family transcriptional regulator [Nocardiopsis alborubida]